MSPPPTSIDGTDITGATIDGQDVQEITIDGQVVFVASTEAVFVDDWADGNLFSNRTSFDTLAYTGPDPFGRFVPVGRFPWETPSGESASSLSGNELLIQTDEVAQNDATLDMTTGKTVWEAEIDFTNGGTGGRRAVTWNLAYDSQVFDSGDSKPVVDSYCLKMAPGVFIGFNHFDSNGNRNQPAFKSTNFTNDVHVMRIEREANGDFTVFDDGDVVFTFNDTSLTSTSFTGFSGQDGDVGNVTVDYLEIFQPN
jgi:hypothetical protein